MNSGKRQRGFTYLVALLTVATTGIALAATAEVWSHARQREKEVELMWVGNQFKEAIGLYYQRTPGSVKRYPEKVEDLLEDRRHLGIHRYLRRVYPDPITGRSEWGLVPAPDGGIMGVYSLSSAHPVREKETGRYDEWKFIYVAPPGGAGQRIDGLRRP